MFCNCLDSGQVANDLLREKGTVTRVSGGGVALRNRRRPNGSDVKLRGQGPRGYGSAARRLPAFEARDAGGVTPFKYRRTSRLGRRAEAGPRQLLRRVRRRLLFP